MPSVATRRSDTRVLSSLKRNTPGRWPVERHHARPPHGVHSSFGEFRLLMGTDGTIEDVAFRPDGDDTPGAVAACSEEASLKPAPDKAPIRLLLFNDTGADINLVSVEDDGQRTRRGTIGTDRSGSILSYVARPWIITDAAGTCLEIVWPGQRTRFLLVHSRQEGDQPDRAIAMRRMPTAGSEEALHRYI